MLIPVAARLAHIPKGPVLRFAPRTPASENLGRRPFAGARPPVKLKIGLLLNCLPLLRCEPWTVLAIIVHDAVFLPNAHPVLDGVKGIHFSLPVHGHPVRAPALVRHRSERGEVNRHHLEARLGRTGASTSECSAASCPGR